MNFLGLDVGGVNIKAALVKTENHLVKELRTEMEYFPIWKRGKGELPKVLQNLANRLAPKTSLNGVGVTMTAELSDVYQTKRDGVNHILDCVADEFSSTPLFILTTEAKLISVEEARMNPLKVASANWAATGWMVSRMFSKCIIVDVGSTSTSIIPIVNGRIAAEGETDLDKLANGELVYTGALRTNIAAIVNCIPLRGKTVRVSSELFAQSGDVHLILGHISEREYFVDTADGRGKSKAEAMARLARVVCADEEMLSQKEIVEMARFIHDRQVEQIAQALMQTYERIKQRAEGNIPIVIVGIGNFLGRNAAERIGVENTVDLSERLGGIAVAMAPSIGVAVMVADMLEGGIRWKPS